MEIRVKKGVFNASKYEDVKKIEESESAVEQRKKNAYLNHPTFSQLPIIVSDLISLNRNELFQIKGELNRQVAFYKHVLKIIDRCEFYNFTDTEFKKFVSILKDFGCEPYDKIHPSFKQTGSRELTETVGLKNNIEAPIEIIDRLLNAENFESTRILISNGALRKWISSQEEKKLQSEEPVKKLKLNILPDESSNQTETEQPVEPGE